jgi:rhamnose transport system permease protein
VKISFGRAWPSIATLAMLLLFLAFAAPRFYNPGNLRDLALTNVSVLLVALGMTLVIIVAQIDISVGSLFAVCSVFCGVIARLGAPTPVWAFGAVATGAVLGSINGGLVSFVKAPSIVVTLATMVAWRETLNWATGGAWIEGLPATFQWFGLGQSAGEVAIIICALGIVGVIGWASQHIAALRIIFATGSDTEAARLAGIPVKRVVFYVFVLMGALTGIAALLNSVRFSDVPANTGMNLELKAIAAVVVGGTPITGGRGTLLGTFCGVILLGVVAPALTFLGINPYWEKAVQGAIILATVFFDAITSRRGRRLGIA